MTNSGTPDRAKNEPPAAAMLLRIRHLLRLEYDSGADASMNEVRMTPLNTADQQVLRSRLEIRPTPWSFEYTDYWGTQVTSFEVYEPHDELTVVATSVVQTRESPVRGSELTWLDLEGLADEFCELLTGGSIAAPLPDLAQLATSVRAAARSPRDAVAGLCAAIAEQSPPPTTSAANEISDRVTRVVGALRLIGIPTRYLTGYVHRQATPVVGEVEVTTAHAWLEYFDGEWVGYDPVLLTEPGSRHVVLAHGRDPSDVAAIAGIYSPPPGGEPEPATVTTEIEITRLQ